MWELWKTGRAFCGPFSKRGGNGGKTALWFFHGFHGAAVSTARSATLAEPEFLKATVEEDHPAPDQRDLAHFGLAARRIVRGVLPRTTFYPCRSYSIETHNPLFALRRICASTLRRRPNLTYGASTQPGDHCRAVSTKPIHRCPWLLRRPEGPSFEALRYWFRIPQQASHNVPLLCGCFQLCTFR